MTKQTDPVPIVSGNRQKNVRKTTNVRLIDTLLELWAELPADSISVRALVQQAGTAQSAIHYHFDDLEHLYVCASEAALAAAEDWMELQLAALVPFAGRPLPTPVQATILTCAIADWTGLQRRLAMASRRAPNARWQDTAHGYWHRLAEAIGLGPYAATIACYAAGESARHLLVWHRALDRALLDETTGALLAWLTESRFAGDTVRVEHRDLARRSYSEPLQSGGGERGRIEDAAAELLADRGHAGVTFRAVAARAGVTLGQVIHSCGTKSELLRRALHRLYEREALDDQREIFVAQFFPPQELLEQLLEAILTGHQPVLRAYNEIELAIYNGEEFNALRGVIRSMEDPSAAWALQQMLGGRVPSASLVASFAAIIRGIGFHAEHARAKDARLETMARRALKPFVLQE